MPLVVITLGILLLFLLILVVRLNAFIAFLLVGLAIGIGQGMELNDIVESIEKGIGNTLGFLVIVTILGNVSVGVSSMIQFLCLYCLFIYSIMFMLYSSKCAVYYISSLTEISFLVTTHNRVNVI